MVDFFGLPDRAQLFLDACQGKPVDIKDLFEGYESSVDWPGNLFYQQALEKFPDLKVIHTVRDPESWYTSVKNTIYPAAMVLKNSPDFETDPTAQMVDAIVWQGDFQGRFDDKELTLETYRRHNEGVPFPRANDTESFNQRIAAGTIQSGEEARVLNATKEAL
jgi:hypothetical protein